MHLVIKGISKFFACRFVQIDHRIVARHYTGFVRQYWHNYDGLFFSHCLICLPDHREDSQLFAVPYHVHHRTAIFYLNTAG